MEARAKQTAEQVQKVGQAMLAMGAAITAVAGLAVREAAQFETLEVRLQAIFNSTEKGTAAFKELQKVAALTPFSLQAVVKAGATLAAYMGQQKTKAVELTASIADLAAFMGDDIPQAASAFGRAFAAGAGAADMLRERGVLALVAEFAKMKYGIEDMTRVTLPEFREILIEAIQDPSLGIAGSTERLSRTFSGAMSNMKDALSQLAAAFGKELLPALKGAVRALTEFLGLLNKLPHSIKSAVSWLGSLTGAFGLLAGGIIVLSPRLTGLILLLRGLLGILKGTGMVGLGLIGALVALALAMKAVDEASRGAGQAARDLAAGGAEDLKARLEIITARMKKLSEAGREDWHEFAVLSAAAEDLNRQLDALAQAGTEVVKVQGEMAKAAGILRKELTDLELAGMEATQAMLDRINAAALLVAKGIFPEEPEGEAWRPERIVDPLEKVAGKFDYLAAAAQGAGEAIGRAFGQMATGVQINVAKMLASIGLMIAKTLILKALAITLGGPASWGFGLVSGILGGLIGGAGFDNPIADTQAFRWGMDFTRQFGAGMNSMLGNGLGVPKMEPATIAGGMGGIGFDVHVHNAGPDTYVNIVRKSVAGMSDNDRLGLMRDGLGRAYDNWDGR